MQLLFALLFLFFFIATILAIFGEKLWTWLKQPAHSLPSTKPDRFTDWKKDSHGRAFRLNKSAVRRNRDPYMRSLNSEDDFDYYERMNEWEDEIEYKDER